MDNIILVPKSCKEALNLKNCVESETLKVMKNVNR